MAALNLGQNSAAPQDPGPGMANKEHNQLVLGKETFNMEPLAQLRSQGLSPGILLGPTLPGPPTAPRVPPQAQWPLVWEQDATTLFQLRRAGGLSWTRTPADRKSV